MPKHKYHLYWQNSPFSGPFSFMGKTYCFFPTPVAQKAEATPFCSRLMKGPKRIAANISNPPPPHSLA